ncbi:MAG: hypothetical protein K2M07_07315 [Muribaculaceae bacterium]|nr:hypothetical protein [Muribaculaceae bacterium]
MWLFNSSIGRKFIMCLTGAFLVLFVTFHCVMNSVAIFWPAAYNCICEFLGANWYALLGTMVLAAGFILHIIYAFWLTIQNRKARGNDRYAVTSKPAQVEWASQNMLVLGIVILAFLAIHAIQFWYKMQFAEITGNLVTCECGQVVPPAAGTLFLQMAFGQWYTLPIYLIGFIALWFHMTHGFWSMFQSCGWNGRVWFDRLKCIANWWTSIVVLLFIAEAVVFTVNAKNETYLNCPVLQEQYQEMQAEIALEEGVAAPCCNGETADCCQAAGECCGSCQGDACAADAQCCGKCAEGQEQCCGKCVAEGDSCCGKCKENVESENK